MATFKWPPDGSGGGGSGTVTSVALTVPSVLLSVSGSPITTSGTFAVTLATQTANTVLAGATSGGAATPTFRTLVAADIPSLSSLYVPLAGGTMTGDLILTTAANGITIGAATTKSKALYIKPGASGTGIQLENANNTRKFNIDVSNANFTLFGQDATNGLLTVSNVATGGTGVNWFSMGASGGANPPPYPKHFNCISGDGNITALSSVKALDGVSINDAPWVVLSNANATVNTLVGWVTAGSSKNPMSFVGTQNKTQTATSEVSDLWFATQKAGTLTLGLKLTDQGQLAIQQAGAGLSVKTGSNCKMGTSTMVAGTVTIATTAVTASSKIFYNRATTGGTVGDLSRGTIVAGTSFVINSTSALDTSDIDWLIVEPS